MSNADKSKYKPVTHVIFALDGLLVNTEAIARQIFNDICEKYKKGLMSLDLQYKLLGRSEKDALNMVINEKRLPIRFPQMKIEVNEMEKTRYDRVKLFPGVERLVCHLFKKKIPMALATSSRLETIDLKIAQVKGIFSNIHHVVSGSEDPEVPNSKPDPTIFTVCCSRFDPPAEPENCLVIESSPAGVSAACCAGMQVVMVPDPLLDPELIKDATLVLTSLADFRPEEFGLPAIPR